MSLASFVFTKGELVEGSRIIFYMFGYPVSLTVVTTWVIMFLLFLVFKLGTRKLQVVPGKMQTLFEAVYNFLDGLMSNMLGVFKDSYFSYIGSLFLFILLANIVSFFPIPWIWKSANGYEISAALRSPTADLNTTVGLALVTTVVFIGTNIKHNGILGYLKGFISPNVAILPLNIAGEIAKPVNIAMRLFGNMFAGMVIMGLLYKAVPWGIPSVLHLYFDLFAGLVQSFVFTLLTMVYISGSLPSNE